MPVTIVGNNTPTAGGVVYGDGTNYASTAAGTSGQVLTSNGSSAPSWVSVSSGALTLISTQTASNSASISWTGLSTYRSYILQISNFVPQTGADSLYLTLGTGGTPTYIASGYYSSSIYNAANSSLPDGSNGNNTAQIDLTTGNTVSNTAGLGGWSGTIYLINMLASPAADTRVTFSGVFVPSTIAGTRQFSGGGTVYNNTTAKTAVKLNFSSDNIASGSASLYGIAP